jgi:putative transposase
MVGIDMGVVRFATLSNGEVIKPLNSFRRRERKIRRLQKSVSRKRQAAKNAKRKPGGSPAKRKPGGSLAKARRKLARQHKKIADRRKDFLQKASTDISKSHAIVVVEALKVKNMSASAAGTVEVPGKNVKAKSGLNKSIRDQGWHTFKVMLKNKLMMKGGQLIEVPPQYTSQKCPQCGYTAKENRLTQAEFKCKSCGYENNADLVGALNVLAA